MSQSVTKGGLYEALRAFQADAPAIPLDSTNPHFRAKFASLPNITQIIRPRLAEHGLVWSTQPSQDDQGRPTLKYRLAHALTGETINDEMPLLLVKQDPQGLGSAITYARRYALLAVLNLVADDDDDGHRASSPPARDTSHNSPADTHNLLARKHQAVMTAASGRLTALQFVHAIRSVRGLDIQPGLDEDGARKLVDHEVSTLDAEQADTLLARLQQNQAAA